jgi:nondiscriminating aspartyl-tRNA synthetase
VGESVQLKGWLHHLRRLRNVSFLLLRDGRGIAQMVLETADLARSTAALPHESVLEVEGLVVAEPQAPGGVELRRVTVRVLSEAISPPPVDLSRPVIRAQLPTLLDHAPVTLRHPRRRACFQLADAALAGFRAALRANGFVEIQTPKIVAAATAVGADLFAVDYFGRPAFLAQSPQFYKQIMVGVFERVFEVGPVFRAEPHDTPRHVNEYVSLDAEMGFIEDHRAVMDLLRDVLAGMLTAMERESGDALRLLDVGLPRVPLQVPMIHFTEAQLMLRHATGEDLAGEVDLAPAHEAWLGQWAAREHASDFLFVTGYPMVKRPFYTHPDPGGPSTRTASTSFSEASSWRRAGSACIDTTTTSVPWPPGTWIRRRSKATWRPFGTGCHPTVASRSAWSDGSRGLWGRRTSGRPPSSLGTLTVSVPDELVQVVLPVAKSSLSTFRADPGCARHSQGAPSPIRATVPAADDS